MKIILRHVLKNIVEKKLRTSIVFVTILFSTMVLFIGLSLNTIINNTYSSMLQGIYGDSNIVITKSAADGDPFYKRTEINLESVSVEQRIDQLHANGKVVLNDEDVNVTLSGMDMELAEDMELVAPIRQLDGFDPRENMVMVSHKTASDYGLNLGDELIIDHGEETNSFKVGAINESNGMFYSETGERLFVTSLQQVNRLNKTNQLVSTTLIQAPENRVDSAIEELEEVNSEFTIQKTGSADTVLRDEQTFQTVMMLAIIIIVLISAYVISSLTKLIIAERLPVMGTFRSVGLNKGMMNCILLLEFFLYGLFGSILGIVLAYFLLPFAADIFNEYKEYGVETAVEYQLSYLIIAFLFGMIFPAFISFFRIRRANSKPLKDLILNTQHTTQKQSRISLLIGIVLLAGAFALYYINQLDNLFMAVGSIVFLFIAVVLLMPGFLYGISKFFHYFLHKFVRGDVTLGIRNVANNKIVANNSSMIIVVFLLLMMVGMTSAGIDQYLANSMKKDFDVSISGLEDDMTNYTEILEMDEVAKTHNQYISIAEYDIGGDRNTFAIHGVEDFTDFDEFYEGITFPDDSETRMGDLSNGIIIDEYQAEKYNLEVGETIRLQPLDANYQSLNNKEAFLDVEIAGTMESSGFSQNRDTVLLNLNYFQDHFSGLFNQVAVKANKGYEADVVKEAIADRYADSSVTVTTFDEVIASQKETVDTLIDGITIIIVMGLLIGLLGISNNLIVSFTQRKKEYALLYSVCMSRMQIIMMIFIETLMTFFTVVIIGFIGGLALKVLMTKLLYAIGLRIEYSFSFELYGILCAAVFLLLSLSILSIVRKVFKLNVLKELRYE
ncbi:hypothetical protein CIL05_17860 [Virgibacillus profundi]|uniref:Uncharacterized protein n=1 Tax=Virgibacillus profundi TaxID=2024555 RepID=A0A2A2I9I0_9BACI|nr:ABC transporter permease [Virgibacillus profundi]PAV28232.1 hypothetical protein CIL05_17860 [Virgibacillus profundi]PXY52537.1 hypothetical protein CIT14_17300 [Virgibacillus profundi]